MAQKSILSFFGGASKGKSSKNELNKPDEVVSPKKKGDVGAVKSDGEWSSSSISLSQ